MKEKFRWRKKNYENANVNKSLKMSIGWKRRGGGGPLCFVQHFDDQNVDQNFVNQMRL